MSLRLRRARRAHPRFTGERGREGTRGERGQRIRGALDDIAALGADALDPIEPPPQGDVGLAQVRARHGRQMVLFGNLEASDLENLPTALFSEKVRRALDEGTAGAGRGFVLMPSACPYGRRLSTLALRNYETMVEMAERW